MPPALVISAAVVVGAILLPLLYLFWQLTEADSEQVRGWLLRPRNLTLAWNTLRLVGGVVLLTSLLAIPGAWLTTCVRLPGRRWFTILGILPLAIPGYLMAYTLLGLGGLNGVIATLTPLDTVPRPSGYAGALLALSLTNFPYLFLSLRAAWLDLDPSLEEAARSLGAPPREVLWRVLIPHLRPAYLTGVILISLHVVADFGVVSLMRFETFSYALYTSLFNRGYAAVIALLLVIAAGGFLWLEYRALGLVRLDRTGTGIGRRRQLVELGRWQGIALIWLLLVALASLATPLGTIAHWAVQSDWQVLAPDVLRAGLNSLRGSLPAALLAPLLAVPFIWLSCRFPSPGTQLLERFAYLGYATPPLAFALGFVFFSLQLPSLGLYQTMPLLVAAYVLHFLAEAQGPVRSALMLASPRLEEAARILGATPYQAFWRVTFPVLRNGLAAGSALVFLSCMKELPITIVLAPLGFQTLAYNVYDLTSEALYANVAPYALVILLLSGSMVAVLLRDGRRSQYLS